MNTVTALAQWTAPEDGPVGIGQAVVAEQPIELGRGWQSNGGAGRGHPARRLPNRVVIPLPTALARVHSITLVGVFALFAAPEDEPTGSLGASVTLESGGNVIERFNLVNQRHYRDARDPAWINWHGGDGVHRYSILDLDLEGVPVVVDALRLDLSEPAAVDQLEFRDLGTPASFVIFAVVVEGEPAGCPFGPRGAAVALSEVPGVVRLGDRLRLRRATDDIIAGLARCGEDLDEARSLALTFLAVVLAGLVERGDNRNLHRALLDVARELEHVSDHEGIVCVLTSHVNDWTEGQIEERPQAIDRLMDRALKLLDRQFARELTDAALARQLGLSTSHFRHLFRQLTGQPFHRYLMGLRLERARELLGDARWSVTEIAYQVGFTSVAHFSRAYSVRFGAPPSGRRRGSSPQP